MRLIVAGQVPTATADRELFFQDVSLLLEALLGLAVGEEQVRCRPHADFSCNTAVRCLMLKLPTRYLYRSCADGNQHG